PPALEAPSARRRSILTGRTKVSFLCRRFGSGPNPEFLLYEEFLPSRNLIVSSVEYLGHQNRSSFGSGVQLLPETGVVIQNGGGSIQEVGAADILVAIPTYNNADTIRPLMKAAQSGVLQFSTYKTAIMQADGGSDDSTLQIAKDALNGWPNVIQLSYPLYPVHRLAISSYAIPGRDSAFQTIFSTAQRLGVQACCIIEPGIKSVTPDWIGSLVQPVLESSFDFVAPQY